MSSPVVRVLGSGGDDWELIDISAWVSDRWARVVKRPFVVRHLQQWFWTCSEALKCYRSELRDRVSRHLGPGSA